MKKLLVGSAFLTLFSASMLLFQMSCKKADSNNSNNTTNSLIGNYTLIKNKVHFQKNGQDYYDSITANLGYLNLSANGVAYFKSIWGYTTNNLNNILIDTPHLYIDTFNYTISSDTVSFYKNNMIAGKAVVKNNQFVIYRTFSNSSPLVESWDYFSKTDNNNPTNSLIGNYTLVKNKVHFQKSGNDYYDSITANLGYLNLSANGVAYFKSIWGYTTNNLNNILIDTPRLYIDTFNYTISSDTLSFYKNNMIAGKTVLKNNQFLIYRTFSNSSPLVESWDYFSK